MVDLRIVQDSPAISKGLCLRCYRKEPLQDVWEAGDLYDPDSGDEGEVFGVEHQKD